MTWEPEPPKWDYRKFLTVEEALFINRADARKAVLERAILKWMKRYGNERAKIVNRAIQRTKYAAKRQNSVAD